MKTSQLFVFFVMPCVALASGSFYYAPPPPLSEYHERIPAKTAVAMINEQRPRPVDATTTDEMEEAAAALVEKLKQQPIDRPAFIKHIDELLQRNRSGDYRVRYANVLWDIRDLLTSTSQPQVDGEIASYAEWRVGRIEGDDGFFTTEPRRDWSQSDAEYQAQLESWRASLASTLEGFSGLIANASVILKPHYLVQRGAMAFYQHNFEKARADFLEVIDQHKDSPRVQVARLMLGRCDMQQWLEAPEFKADSPPYERFDEYLTHHPKGRYAADIPGWKAGIARKAGDWGLFIKHIAQQMADEAHPEVRRRAAQELDRGLISMAEMVRDHPVNYWGDENPFVEIASQPIVAARVMYCFLDAQSTINPANWFRLQDSSREVVNRRQEPIENLRQIGRSMLPLLVNALSEYRAMHGKDGWGAPQIVLLAWTASQGGLHGQAARLISGDLPATDEVLFARTVILGRAGRSKEAMEAATKLVAQFPDSAFTRETYFRLSSLLKDSGDWAGALLAIEKARTEDNEDNFVSDRSVVFAQQQEVLRLEDELSAWRGTIMKVGNLDQLIRLVESPDTSASLWSELAPTVRQRLLADERFADALKVAARKRTDQQQKKWRRPRAWSFFEESARELDEATWHERVSEMAALQAAIASAPASQAKAESAMKLAALWDESRGHLTVFLRDDEVRFDAQLAGSTELQNAVYLGLKPEQAGVNMDRRDELWHAFQLWIKVADLVPRTPTAATALEKANDALRRMAEFDDTGWERAFETDATGRSRQIYDRLKRDHPSSPEAQRAVHHTFYALHEIERLPNNNRKAEHEMDIVDAMTLHPAQWQLVSNPYGFKRPYPEELLTPLSTKLADIVAKMETQPFKETVSVLQALRHELTQTNAPLPSYSALLNDIDDLVLLATQRPDVPPAQLKDYALIRIDHARVPDAPPAGSSSVEDFLTFLHHIRAPDDSEDKATVMKQRMEDFIKRYPKSPKVEAARTRLIVNTVRASLLKCGIGNFTWPKSPWTGYYVHPFIQKTAIPLDGQNVSKLIADYERDYPKGPYIAEVRMAKALVQLDAGQFSEALNILTAIADDPAKHDLHYAACMRMAYVFMQLLEADQRMNVINAIRSVPASRKYLDRFQHSHTCGARLMLLKDWTASELGG